MNTANAITGIPGHADDEFAAIFNESGGHSAEATAAGTGKLVALKIERPDRRSENSTRMAPLEREWKAYQVIFS